MTGSAPLNSGLYRVHRLFYVAFAAFAAIMLLVSISALFRGGEDAAIGLMALALLPIGLAHWYAAKGAQNGKTYGKVLSRIIGTLWLIGFPIGTVLGIYVLSQTGKKWRDSAASS